jgi:hypothetical protein
MPATAVPAARDARPSFTPAGAARPGAFQPRTTGAGAAQSRSTQPGGAAPPAAGRSPGGGRAARPWRGKPGQRGGSKSRGGSPPKRDESEHDILFQKFFKSVGPRTYAAQVKRATNGNHYLVLMEGKRDEASGEVRKTWLFVYSEDFVEFFRLVKATAEFIKEHPVPDAVRIRQEKRWAKASARGARPLAR